MTREEFHLNAKLAAAIARSNRQHDAAEALEKIALSSDHISHLAAARRLKCNHAAIKHPSKASQMP